LADDLRRYRAREPVRAHVLGPLGRLVSWFRRRPALATTLLALLVFYTNHVLALLLGQADEGGRFHSLVTAVTLLWAGGAAGFQWGSLRPRWQNAAAFGWAALDVLMLTALLLVKDGPSSPLVVGYLLLIAVSALRFRYRMVWFVTE